MSWMASNELWLQSGDAFFFCPSFFSFHWLHLTCLFYLLFLWKHTQKKKQTRTQLNSRHQVKIVLIEYPPVAIVELNWAELRQMRRSKLNKQSSLSGDSTMVIRVSCELPYIIYGGAVGRLQLNKPTVH